MGLNDNKKKKLIVVLIAGLAIGGVFLAFYIINGFTRIGTDDAYITGRVHNIAPKIPGTIKAVHIEDNQNVKKGDILVEIDPVDYELKVNEARAIVGVREATFKQAERDKKRAASSFGRSVSLYFVVFYCFM